MGFYETRFSVGQKLPRKRVDGVEEIFIVTHINISDNGVRYGGRVDEEDGIRWAADEHELITSWGLIEEEKV